MNEFRATPARQSLGRELTPSELALARALEAIFATGQHAMAEVAAELQQRSIAPPSGTGERWTEKTLEVELRRINASLDAAYGGRPPSG